MVGQGEEGNSPQVEGIEEESDEEVVSTSLEARLVWESREEKEEEDEEEEEKEEEEEDIVPT